MKKIFEDLFFETPETFFEDFFFGKHLRLCP